MKRILIIILFSSILFSCGKETEWKTEKTIALGEVTPIGITFTPENGGRFWLADGDNNRLVSFDKEFKGMQIEGEYERPMHLSYNEGEILIPEYGSDRIVSWKDGKKTVVPLQDSLDAPGGVDARGKELAIADFYNHRILYSDGNDWIRIGKKGKKEGEFHYPTDVQITDNLIYVADAYNHRVQVFDKKGTWKKTIGTEEKMNAATGIYISDNEIFVTDFENSRLLIYDLNGGLKQILNNGYDNPTDALIVDGKLYVTNFKAKNIVVLNRE